MAVGDHVACARAERLVAACHQAVGVRDQWTTRVVEVIAGRVKT